MREQLIKIHEAYQTMRFILSTCTKKSIFEFKGESMMASMTANLPELCSKETTEPTEKRTQPWIRDMRCRRQDLLWILGLK